MKKYVEVYSLDNERSKDLYVIMPTVCPDCGIAYGEPPIEAFSRNVGNSYRIIMVFECPHCSNFFAFRLSGTLERGNSINATHIELLPEPKNNELTSFPKSVSNLSPDFVSIFNQAEIAESRNLYHICGVGYRKALEFLIKDYAIHCYPQDSDKIASMPLAQCINDYIRDHKLHNLAKAAAWLGNDETHYLRKYEGYDLDSLKSFISTATALIHFEIQAQDAVRFLDAPKVSPKDSR